MQVARSAGPQFGTATGSALAYARPELGFGTTGDLHISKCLILICIIHKKKQASAYLAKACFLYFWKIKTVILFYKIKTPNHK